MNNKNSSFFYLKIFFIVTIILFLTAIIFKFATEISESKFGNNSFGILFISNDSKYIYVDKDAKEIVFLALGDLRKYAKGKNNVGVSFALGLPVNGLILNARPPVNIAEFVSSESEWNLIFNNTLNLKNMNRYDVYKFISESRGIPKDNKKEMRVNIFDREEFKKIDDYLLDTRIVNNPITIEILNGTSINGLGNLLAQILSKRGYNVISVRTSKPQVSSFIAYEKDDKEYMNSLVSLLNFEIQKKKISQAADVTIFLGDDLEAMLLP